MSTSEFMDYVQENFTVSGEFMRLLDNVIDNIRIQGYPDNEQNIDELESFLDGTIGIERTEYENLDFSL